MLLFGVSIVIYVSRAESRLCLWTKLSFIQPKYYTGLTINNLEPNVNIKKDVKVESDFFNIYVFIKTF